MSRPKASENDTKAKTIAPNTAKTEPKVVMREHVQVQHHLFKSDVSKMLKNVSFIPGSPSIQQVEHVHFFHSINSGGAKQKYTSEIGGHFHEIKWGLDADGYPTILECGPALKKISKRGRNGLPVSQIVQIKYPNENKENDKDPDVYVDNHVHNFNYLGTDHISTGKITEIQKSNAAALREMGVKPPAPTATKVEDESLLVDNDR